MVAGLPSSGFGNTAQTVRIQQRMRKKKAAEMQESKQLFKFIQVQVQVQVELYCHSATCVDIQWNKMSCLAGPRCYINKHKHKHTTLDVRTIFDLHS